MSKKPETVFKERIRPLLDALPFSWWLKTQMVALIGIPDFIGCINGYFVALELKKSKKDKPDKIQQWVMNKIIQAGGMALVVTPENWEATLAVLKGIATGKIVLKPEPPTQKRELNS